MSNFLDICPEFWTVHGIRVSVGERPPGSFLPLSSGAAHVFSLLRSFEGWISTCKARCADACHVNYPAPFGRGFLLHRPCPFGSYSISTGVECSVRAVSALQQTVYSGCLVLATQTPSNTRYEKKMYRLEPNGKGGSASRKMLCIFLSGNFLWKFPCHPH